MGRTIRTCSVAALFFAATAAQTAVAARDDLTTWRAYVRGRAAISQDQLGEAARQFQTALKANSDNQILRQRTFGLALLSGQEKLSQDLARQLEAMGDSAFDTRIVLLGNAIERGKWAQAKALRNELSQERQLLFAMPVIDAWLAFGAGGDALEPLAMVGRDAVANNYAAEHRAFILGALGRVDEAMDAYRPLIAGDSGRAVRLRLAAAAMLQRAKRDREAIMLLEGSNVALQTASAYVKDGKKLEMGVATPAQGIAELFARLAADVSRERPSQVSIVIGRMATFLAPGNAETWLVVADMLAGDGKPDAALEALSHVSLTDPFAEQAIALRISLLQQLKRDAEALGIAQAATTRPGAGVPAWSRLGDVLVAIGNNADAAAAYSKAIDMAPKGDVPWQLYLLRGGAYERIDDWKRAEADLRRAVEMAPDQAVTLNYLGYALLDRNLNLDEAQRLIEKASALRPQDGPITDSLAWVHYRRGDFHQAIRLLEQAVRMEPAEPTINEHLGDAYWQVGRKIEARYSWRAAMVGTDEEPVLKRLRKKIDFGLQIGAD